MRRHLSACLLAITMAGLYFLSKTPACAPVMGKGETVAIATESALIAWDAKTKTETFIRRAKFDTAAPYFGFLVPTPTAPRVDEVPDSVFSQLEEWTRPEVRTETRIRHVSLFSGTLRGEFAADKGAAGVKDTVKLLDAGTVAGLEFAVLKANDAAKLHEWLTRRGYDARPAITEWLQDYVKKGWIITAFQFKKENARAPGLATAAIRMTFQAEQPFYPYREPADARPADNGGPRRFLRVFFVGDGRHDGKLEDKDRTWPGRVQWAQPLTANRKEALAKASPVSEGAWLTVFDDASTPRMGTAEVFFHRSPEQAEVARPPILRYHYEERVSPGELTMLWTVFGVAVVGGIYLVRRYGLRPATQEGQ